MTAVGRRKFSQKILAAEVWLRLVFLGRGVVNFTRFEQHYLEAYGETFSDVQQRVFGNKKAKALFSQELRDIISVKLNWDGMMRLKLRQGATASREPRHFPAAEPRGTRFSPQHRYMAPTPVYGSFHSIP